MYYFECTSCTRINFRQIKLYNWILKKSELLKWINFSLFLSSVCRCTCIFSMVERNSEKFNHFRSSDFSKSKSLHRNEDTYEFHANLPIFKKSKNGLNSHQSKNNLTTCLTNIWKLDLGGSDFKFMIFRESSYQHTVFFDLSAHLQSGTIYTI